VTVDDVAVTGSIGVGNLDTDPGAEPWQFVHAGIGSVNIPAAGRHVLKMKAEKLAPGLRQGLTMTAVELIRI
jgi:hypothetical protein